MEEAGEVERLAHREVVLLGTTVVSVAGVARFCSSIYMLTMGFGVWSYLRKLEILDLSKNNELDESSIPSLVAVSSLRSLYLSGNAFGSNRTIQQLSTMKLHTLDLGYNNFTGTLSTEEFMTKSREEYYKGDILNYMSGLDFSSNQLTGSIQESIGNMKWLRALNFSDNHLDGSIPNSLSKLSDLESLDLSHNKLIGQIPVELVALQSLAVFSVAYNNLSGPTPGTTGQFITFDQSSYEGNAYLCGLPLLKNCSMPPSTPPFKEHGDDKVDDIILFGCSAMFYLVGFWTSLGVLYFKRSWRCTWFSGVDRFGDFVMIKVPIFTRKIRSTNWPFWRAV
uniref:Uncharacterized protein n=1 Tax=Avena sativa TaxID=4498 RepID=A0ACD5YW79_AVESA